MLKFLRKALTGSAEEAEQLRLASEERKARKEADEKSQEAQRRRAEAEALYRVEQQARQNAEKLRRKAQEVEQAFKDERARFEQLQKEREHTESLEIGKRAEAKKLASERERKQAVATFLTEQGFSSVHEPKTTLMRTTSALHRAAEKGNAQMVEMLLKEGAPPLQTDSQGMTALQAAQSKDSNGSHTSVIQVLVRAQSGRSADSSNQSSAKERESSRQRSSRSESNSRARDAHHREVMKGDALGDGRTSSRSASGVRSAKSGGA